MVYDPKSFNILTKQEGGNKLSISNSGNDEYFIVWMNHNSKQMTNILQHTIFTYINLLFRSV